MRVLIISLSTYSAPYNDGKLAQLGPRLDALTAVAGDVPTLWGGGNHSRVGAGYEAVVLQLRRARSNATAKLVGLDQVAEIVQPTVIHVECEPWQSVAVQSVRLAERLGVPIGVLFAECGPRLRGVGGRIRRTRGSWVLKRCSYAVGWSSASTRVAGWLAPGIRTETFPATGISLGAETTARPDDWFGSESAGLPKLAFVGRFAAEKGIADFLRICEQLEGRVPLRVALAGGEGANGAVERWVDIRPWATLHGVIPRTEVSSLLAAADVLVCPSRTTSFAEEQFGKAAVEAMAVGTPVFAYNCGALSEVIGTGGIVVAEGAQDQIVDELEGFFASSSTERVALARAAMDYASRFTDEALANKLIDLWTSCDQSVGGAS